MEDTSKDDKIALGDLLPQEINGWRAETKDEIYDPQTIFDYIDGAGEVYRSYNFKKLLARRFTKEGKKPDVVSLLPSENLAEKSAHYFHNHLILNYHFYVSDENILLLDQQTEAALGIYGEDNEKSYLLVVHYTEGDKASQAHKSFMQSYMPDATEMGLVQTEDLKWTAAKLYQDFIIIIFNAPSRFLAIGTIEKVEKRIGQI